MKIMQVIHGYPPIYNAGSEIYTQTLSNGLTSRHEVNVFTREEDPFRPDFDLRVAFDPLNSDIKLYIINIPRSKDRYRHVEVDDKFEMLLASIAPDIIHVGHLNHLSTSLIESAVFLNIPIVFTLHDYWLMCPRGQFMQMNPEKLDSLWAVCDGQEDAKCAKLCYARYYSGSPQLVDQDLKYWTSWVKNRMRQIEHIAEKVDMFIAPAKYLMERFINDFGIPRVKIEYVDYGFDLERFVGRKRRKKEIFTFGYIGTHIPAKGIDYLLKAFSQLNGKTVLRIYGRTNGQNTASLKRLADRIIQNDDKKVYWVEEYQNPDIVKDVFNYVDAIVVPSIWMENSPLVIHEAQQCRVPVITANAGGMNEYVHHEGNGLLFDHRSVSSLSKMMQRFIDDPDYASSLGKRGYIYHDKGDIPNISDHVNAVEMMYLDCINKRDALSLEKLDSPWRITFDTNPDDCNLACIMCEEHALNSTKRKVRKRKKLLKREMPFELIEHVVKECHGRGLKEIIPSTMGEPLLYKDFERIVDLCCRYNIKLNLTTNGTFPRGGVEKWAALIAPVTSDIKISLNGAGPVTQEKIMKGSNWMKMMDNIKYLIKVRDEEAENGDNFCRITFQMTFLENNYREIPAIILMARDLGVNRVKGHHVWTHFPELNELSMQRDRDSISRWNGIACESKKVAIENGITLENVFEIAYDNTASTTWQGKCPFLGQEAWINTEGRFDPCCAPDELRKSLGYLGNIKENSFMDLWRSREYQILINTYRNHSVCLDCKMHKPLELS
jgi:glycosyltransferase involved in cell wall biosynthesis/MoaA/NifB/PqqE/SkfB family radical SAM enzyme